MIDAVRSAFQAEIELRHFESLCENPADAEALHAIHADRVRWHQENRPRQERDED